MVKLFIYILARARFLHSIFTLFFKDISKCEIPTPSKAGCQWGWIIEEGLAGECQQIWQNQVIGLDVRRCETSFSYNFLHNIFWWEYLSSSGIYQDKVPWGYIADHCTYTTCIWHESLSLNDANLNNSKRENAHQESLTFELEPKQEP